MTQSSLLIHLCSIGVLAGAVGVTAPARGTSAGVGTSAATPSVEISSGPALDGRRSDVTLTVRPAATGRRRGISDLLPSGVAYVPGSSRLGSGRSARKAGDPRLIPTPTGTLLVWDDLAPPTGKAVLTLTFAVGPVGTHPPMWSWTDQATASSAVVTPVGANLTATALGVATARRRIDVTPLRAVETARRTPSPGRPVTSSTQSLVERVSAETGSVAPSRTPTLTVYLPGTVRWTGCAPAAGCHPPTVGYLRARTEPGHPDLPLLTRPPATSTRTRPAGGTPRTFTVLTWHLRGLHAATSRTWAYRIDALATRTPRTQDLVVVSVAGTDAAGTHTAGTHTVAAITVTTIQTWPAPASAGGTHPTAGGAHSGHRPTGTTPPKPTTGRTTSDGSTTAGSTGARSTGARSTGAPSITDGSTTTRTTTRPTTTTASRRTTTTQASRRTGDPTSRLLAAAPDRNPFSTGAPSASGGTGNTAPTTGSPAKAAATPKTSAAAGAPLAYTGADVEQGGTISATLMGLGGALVLVSRRRRPRRGAHDQAGRSRHADAGTTPGRAGVASAR